MRNITRRAGVACLGLAAASGVPAWGAAPFAFDAAPGRLPKNVVPLAYTLSIVPDAQALTTTGKESVTLEFRSATATVMFNSLNQILDDVRLDGRPVRSVASNDAQQLTTVTLAAPARPGKHTLTFSFAGKMEGQPRGFYRQNYVRPGGAQEFLLSTKMESTDARRMFPCWDEPAFRATFQLTVTVPAAWATIGNMPVATRVVRGDLATTTFRRTPRMPSYLIELTAGDFAALSALSGGTQLGIWADKGREPQGATALENARQILADYNDYFGFAYPLPKLDSIAIPGGFGGAMENWGAITYNDQLLLLTARSTMRQRQDVFAVQAHEMAHQWNGDLVTMGWWDDLWLNESFASWRGAKETDLRNPTWKWWEVQDGAKESAMHGDAFAVSHPIEQHVADELQAANAFDAITYNKGQAVLRMLEAYLGERTFRDGVRRYVKARAFSNATSGDLWKSLGAASGKDVAALAAPWIEQPGFPLVSVASRCDEQGRRSVTLTQQRFLLSGTDTQALRWSIPVRMRSGVNGEAQAMVLEGEQSVPAGRCDEPLSLNPDAVGYYRVQYDAAVSEANVARFAELRDGDRIAMLDDQWALVEAGSGTLASYLALAGAAGDGLDARVWQQLAGALASIEYDARGAPAHAAAAAYARSIIRPVAQRLGWDARPDETPAVQELRRLLIRDLGVWGDPQILEGARSRFAAFVEDHGAISPDDQPGILSIVAMYADAATFAQLHDIAKAARDETEQQRFFLALMDVGDPALAVQAAAIALSPEIPTQGARWRMRLVVRLANLHPELAWRTFKDNAQMLLAPNPKYAPLIMAESVPVLFWDCVPLDELEAFVRQSLPEEMAPNIARGMEAARFNVAEKERIVPAIGAYRPTAQN